MRRSSACRSRSWACNRLPHVSCSPPVPCCVALAVQAEQEYADCLASCAGEDFSDLDALEFLTTGLADKEGRPVLCVVAKHYPARVLQLERVYK